MPPRSRGNLTAPPNPREGHLIAALSVRPTTPPCTPPFRWVGGGAHPAPTPVRPPVRPANFALYGSQTFMLSGRRTVRREFFRPSGSCMKEDYKAMHCPE